MWDKFIELILETESIMEQRGGGDNNQIGINFRVQEITVQCSALQCSVEQYRETECSAVLPREVHYTAL